MKRAIIFVVIAVFAVVLCGCGTSNVFSPLLNATGEPASVDVEPISEPEPEPVIPCSFRVMTYNMRCAVYSGRQDHWINRRAALVKRVLTDAPAIFGTQEVTAPQLEYLEKQFGNLYEHIGIQRAPGVSGEGCYIFYNPDIFELLETDSFWLSETPEVSSKGWDAACERTAVYGVFKHKESGVTFCHLNTHLDHIGYYSQIYSLEMLMDLMKGLDYPTIFTGDLNFSEGSANYLTVTETLDDSKYIAEKTMDSVTFHNYGSITWGVPIDFCFLSRGDFNVSEYKVDTEMVDGWYTSDHYAVLVDLEVKQ